MAQTRGIRIHQYVDDWLLPAPCQETCLDQTQTLLDLCQKLDWVVNLKKSELVLQQVFNCVSYQERWQALTMKIRMLMSKDSCSAGQFISC